MDPEITPGPQLPIHPRWMEYPQSDLKIKGIAVRIIVITAIILALMFVCFPAFRSVWGLWFRRQAEICHALIMVVEKTVVIMIAAKAGLLKPCVFSTSTIEPISGWFPRWGRGKSVDALIFEHLWNRWRSECMHTMLPYVTYKWMYLGSHKLQPSPFRVGNKHQTTSIDRSKQWLPIPKLRGNRLNSCG